MLKLVKKVDEEQIENLMEMIYKIVIMRHKIKMIWFLINKNEKDELLEDSKEEDREDTTEYEKQDKE